MGGTGGELTPVLPAALAAVLAETLRETELVSVAAFDDDTDAPGGAVDPAPQPANTTEIDTPQTIQAARARGFRREGDDTE